jgi:hypothetical protein
MKHFLLLIFFTVATINPTFSQVDTTSSMDALLKQGHDKAQENKTVDRKFGCSIFGGLGKGGNHFFDGFGSGIAARAHYKFHTVNIYASLATKKEERYGSDYTYDLYSSNYGFVYGPGFHDKNFSASCGIGLGYYWTTIDMNNFISTPTLGRPDYVTYKKIATCIGAQLTAHGKYLGLTGQFLYNTANPVDNYTVLVGLEIIFW